MSFLTTILVAFAIGFTGTAQQAPEAPVQPATVQQVVQHDPILAMDADVTLDDCGATKEFTDEHGNHYVANYVGTDVSSDSMFGEFTLESIDFPGNFHHYTYEVLKTA